MTPAREMLTRPRQEAHQELLEAWHGPTHPTVRRRRGSLPGAFLMALVGPFVWVGAIYAGVGKELANVARPYVLEILGVTVMAYALIALQLVEVAILLALFCVATEILARGLRRAHLWCLRRPMSWRKLIALNERKPKKPRKRRDEVCVILGAAASVLGSLVVAIVITAIGA